MASITWNDLRISKQLCDGVIKTLDGGYFPIHRVILCAFSPYFRAHFTNSLNNGNPEVTELIITDTPSEIIGLIIEFAYTQHCAITMGNVHALMVAGDRFSCESIVNVCCDIISRNITPSNCISTLRFAKTYFNLNLENKAWKCICDNIEDVVFIREFCTLMADELEILLKKDELNVRTEDFVFEAISRWISFDPESRKNQLTKLLHCMRFGHVSVEYFNEIILTYQYHSKESIDLITAVNTIFENNESAFFYQYDYFRPRIPNEVIFVFGGWSDGSPTDIIETYDKRTDGWYLSNIRDQTIRAYHGVIMLNNLIYVLGGFDGTEYFSTMHCFDPVNCQWKEKACMHDVRCYVSVCSLEEEIYAIGGYNGRSRLRSVERYNPKLNQWTIIAPLNMLRSDASATSLNNKIFVAGGFNGQEVMKSVEMYSPTTNQWDFVDSMRVPRSGVSMITLDCYIYALGGFDGVTRLYSCERYHPSYNRWEPIADMLVPRSNMASVIIDNYIFVIGGYNGTSTIANTEFYDVKDNIWYESSDMNINRSALSACVCHGLPNVRNYTFLGFELNSNPCRNEWVKVPMNEN